MLPSPFAIFTDRPPMTSRDVPKSYAIISAEKRGHITRYYQIFPDSNEDTVMHITHTNDDARPMWIVDSGRAVHFWFTGWCVDGIMVFDYDDRTVLNFVEYTHSVHNDDIMTLCSRQVEQRHLRHNMMGIILNTPLTYSDFYSPPRVIRQTWPNVFSVEDNYEDVLTRVVRPAPLEIPELVLDEFDEAPRAPLLVAPLLVAPLLVVPEHLIIPSLVPPAATIPKFVADAMKRDAIASGGSCPITTATFEKGTAVAVTACYHLFEDAALKQWMMTSMSCPICKALLTDSPTVV